MDAWFRTGSCRKTKLSSDEGTSSSRTTSSEIVDESSLNITKKTKIYFRKYNPDFLKIGFVFFGTEEEPMPQCVICFETLSNECMKFSKLERHLSTKHPECVGKSLDFFQIKKKNLSMTKSVMEKSSKQNIQSTQVSYELSLLIAKKGSAHTVGEELIIPAAKIISNALFDEKCTKKINEIPLSNTTVKRRIDEMSENVKIAIITVLKQSEYFSLQLDESTDVAGQANLLAFVRFESNGNIEEEMLFCQSLSTKTTGEEIFKSVDSFMKENEVDWSKCVGLTTDGARAMSGIHTGLIARVRSVAPLVQWTHCSIHREALAVKGLDECLKKTLDDAVKIVNFIKARPKNSRLFGVLCDEMGSEHKQLLLHCEVRWLSRGKVLSRLFELRDELRIFLMEEDCDGKLASSYLELVTDKNWLKRLAYLADIFGALNVLNLTLQGKDVNKFFVQDKVDAMIIKLQRWALKVEQDFFDAFPVLHDFLETNEVKIDKATATTIQDHLKSLASNLRLFLIIYFS